MVCHVVSWVTVSHVCVGGAVLESAVRGHGTRTGCVAEMAVLWKRMWSIRDGLTLMQLQSRSVVEVIRYCVYSILNMRKTVILALSH